MGLLSFKVGNSTLKTDWVYVDNLVLSLILASMGLLDDIPDRKHPIAAGQAYFISDGSPVNTFEFIISPLLRSLPKITLDVKHALLMSHIISVIYILLYPWLSRSWLPGPLLPAEVYKVGVTHYFSYLKAREELGYIPMVSPRDGLSATISYWQEKERGENSMALLHSHDSSRPLGCLGSYCAAYLPPVGPVKWLYALHLFVFRSLWITRLVFIAAVVIHIGEGIYAWYLARRRVDPRNSTGWFWQTAAFGFASLRLILKKAKRTSEMRVSNYVWLLRPKPNSENRKHSKECHPSILKP